MSANVDLLANGASSLDATLQQALGTLREKGIRVLAAGQVLAGDDAPIGRILLDCAADRERTIRLLLAARIIVRD
jgi:hypothetical protein